jgi:steroid delta-isomerase-like uncharacterized protein
MTDLKDLVREFYERIWNAYDLEYIPRLLQDDFSFRGSLGSQCHGHREFAAYVDRVHGALGNYDCQIRELIAEGNKVFARMLFSGAHRGELLGIAPTHRTVSWAAAAVFTFQRERIVDLWVLGDVSGLLQQLRQPQ